MDDTNPEDQIQLTETDKAKSEDIASELRETARKLRELSDFLTDLATKPIEPGPKTLH
ncbi:hypothetical protein JZX87_13860 [Agrobacterium sp. Ap1]|uniref:hypothetical protein n=1 Tax=Agrobacterium sp. Ap1 TaxID=2815337 RepID=UPI001A8D0814|nr:hypothetical protein [Agrobacterium sp. Ap1]MBO0142248.1 hypothetical protein [Agrobacterium sp. Ap1]